MMRATLPPPLRVLIVDDCPDTRTCLGLLLRAWGHEACLAADGPDALEAERLFLPDVILLDIGLPGMDGWEACRRLRLQEGRLFLVAMTGFGREEDLARSREAGFDAHLTKPADPDALEALLAAVQAQRLPVLTRA
ncbi:MAG: response regulator [Gemmataceae bacterium]|nr:response regulator [Gemmataceae bacterium]